MKKTILATVALSFGLFGGMAVNNATASAAKVHQGIPSSLRHTKWQGKAHHVYGRTIRSHCAFGKTAISLRSWAAVDPMTIYKLKYKYLGHHVYYFVGRDYENAPEGGMAWRFEVKRYSSHKIYFKDKTASLNSETFTRY